MCLKKPWRIAGWTLTLFFLAMIFSFSRQSGSESGALSTKITAWVIELFTNQTPDIDSAEFLRIHHFVRKIAHATEYGFLAASCALLVHTYPLGAVKRYGISTVLCLLTASTDELLQTFRDARNGSPIDVCIDMGGAVCALLLFWSISQLLLKKIDKQIYMIYNSKKAKRRR